MNGIVDLITNPKLWAYIVTTALAAVQVTATSAQTEMIAGGITAALLLVIHRVVKSSVAKPE